MTSATVKAGVCQVSRYRALADEPPHCEPKGQVLPTPSRHSSESKWLHIAGNSVIAGLLRGPLLERTPCRRFRDNGRRSYLEICHDRGCQYGNAILMRGAADGTWVEGGRSELPLDIAVGGRPRSHG
jgi:hypothetical protein